MAIFEQKHFRSPISKKLATYIIYNQREGDIEEMANKHSYTSHTLTAIIRGRRNLTEGNAPMVIDLFRRCIENYNTNEISKNTINELIQKAI
tara:strand:+ start:227 stop:502 length:276 start_codon:yes stop_codon:yes gene_type:complete